jgi:hypothetical protein
MTTEATPRQSAGPATTLTPTTRQVLRSWRFWIVAAAVVIIAAVGVRLGSATLTDSTPFGAQNPGPTGGRAVAEVLRQQGVDVVEAESFAEARAAADAPESTTLLVDDSDGLLTDDRIEELGALASRLVLVAPPSALLERYLPSVSYGGVPEAEGALEPACDVPSAVRAGSISSSESSFQPVDASDPAAIYCYLDDSGRAQLVQSTDDSRTVTALAESTPFQNENVTADGNAALILGVLGETETLVWYHPGIADVAVGSAPTTADLTPGWVTPLILLLIAVFVTAAVWRGRRLGPLVVEDLPVVVPAGETIEGRARLYARSAARLHALDALRIGTVSRLAAKLRLARTATTTEVAQAVAARLRRPEADIRRLLLDDRPGGDADLVRYAAALLSLERELDAAISVGADPDSRT